MMLRTLNQADIPAVVRLWNGSVEAGEVVLRPIDAAYFDEKFIKSSGYFSELSLVAEEDGRVIGYINGTMKRAFLPGQTHENTPGYLTVVFVDPARRRRGVATALLDLLTQNMRQAGKKAIACVESNPIELDWIVPGTPGHDHNKAPGVDLDAPGYAFLLARGYQDVHHEVAMYLALDAYREDASVPVLREKLRKEGIDTGPYDVTLGYEYNGMCDRVKSEYWRKVIKDEIASPHPRVMLTATTGGQIVGFTGPVDRQESGRGWFPGICTDPLYARRGIATVLFNLLMQEFIAIGATFSTLFTGDDNHAQRLYARTGFRVVRRFAIMRKEL